MRDPSAGLFEMVGRSIRRRCPRCGGSGIFENWAALHDHCPTCGFRFEREPGYWTGALIVNMAASLFVFLLTIVGGLVAFWPDIPWTPLSLVTISVMLVVPIAFYPWSKTIWMAIELSYHQLEDKERFEASLRVADDPRE